jgi:hypothetical protein
MKSLVRASSANNSFATVLAVIKYATTKCGIKAAVVFKLIILAPGVIAGSEPTSEPNRVEPRSEKLLSLSKTARHDSWEACLEAAERARSTRDAEFFRSSKTLSDAKGWFVSHSLNNERLFCDDIKVCEAVFYKHYSLAKGSYPVCEA